MGFFRYLFSYLPPDEPPEVPEEEPADPNADRVLSDSYRAARRSLVAVAAVCVAWATAQLNLADLKIDAAGISVDLKNALVPLLLGVALAYLSARWVIEFAMMPRHVRRWPLAQLDFKLVSVLARFSLLAVTAGALSRSLKTVLVVGGSLIAIAIVSSILSVLLMFVTMPIRMWARNRANRPSAANAAFEALAWAAFFAIGLTVLGILVVGIASYRYQPLQRALWVVPPNPLALGAFVVSFIAVFMSRWLLRPIMRALFAQRPSYRTKRNDDGSLEVRFIRENKESLL